MTGSESGSSIGSECLCVVHTHAHTRARARARARNTHARTHARTFARRRTQAPARTAHVSAPGVCVAAAQRHDVYDYSHLSNTCIRRRHVYVIPSPPLAMDALYWSKKLTPVTGHTCLS